MRRKFLLGIMAAVLVVGLGVSSTYVAEARQGAGKRDLAVRETVCMNMGGVYVDKDEDGTCDNASTAKAYVDMNEDGICDNAGTENKNFVDANEDGICDNIGSRVNDQGQCGYGRKSENTQEPQCGMGRNPENRHSKHHGRGKKGNN